MTVLWSLKTEVGYSHKTVVLTVVLSWKYSNNA